MYDNLLLKSLKSILVTLVWQVKASLAQSVSCISKSDTYFLLLVLFFNLKNNTMVLQELKEFCSETSIHGPIHIVNAQNSILKRLLWFAIFVGCLAYAGNQLAISIKGIYDRY